MANAARRWAWLLILIGAAAVTVVKHGKARDEIDRPGRPLPEGFYRVSIDKLIEEADISIQTLMIETLPKVLIHAEGDNTQGGGGAVTAGNMMPDGSPPKARLTLIGDQVSWPAGRSDLRRFLLRLEGGGGACISSNMGPMQPGKKLETVMKILIKPGLHPYEQSIDLLKFGGRLFRLTINKTVHPDEE